MPCPYGFVDFLQTSAILYHNGKADEASSFIRKGKKGGWKEALTPEIVAKFELWERKWLEGSDLKFTF